MLSCRPVLVVIRCHCALLRIFAIAKSFNKRSAGQGKSVISHNTGRRVVRTEWPRQRVSRRAAIGLTAIALLVARGAVQALAQEASPVATSTLGWTDELVDE